MDRSLKIEIISEQFCATSTSLSRVLNYRAKLPITAFKKFCKTSQNNSKKIPMVFVGPTVEGPDAEYIKVVSGKVDNRKPFFA